MNNRKHDQRDQMNTAAMMLDSDLGLVRIDVENRLFVLAERNGYTCLGF